jgi:diguanylate cyclase (GGDEF)-like protein
VELNTDTVVLLAVASALAAVLLAVLVLWLFRPRGRGAEVAALVTDVNVRMEAMVRELADALDRAREEGRRNQSLGELAGTIDLDEVLTRTLETAGAIGGVDAALLRIEDGDRPIIATLGLSSDEAERQAVVGPPGSGETRSISLVYEYPPELVDGDSDLIHAGLAVPVPVPGEAGPIGFLLVFSRARSHRWGDKAVRELEELALRAGPAIQNARRFREARQLADLDALTGLHNRRYFHETLSREVARAHRYDRKLALIVFDLDDFKAVNDRIGHLPGDAVLAEAAERVRDVVRSADISCRVGGDEFAVILPESTLNDADQLYRRLQSAVSSRPLGEAGRLSLSAGIAELRPGDDTTSFFERADEALYRAKEQGKAQVVESEGA